MAQAALDLSVDYAKTRKQFGQVIGSYQLVQKLIVDMTVRTEAAHEVANMAMQVHGGRALSPGMFASVNRGKQSLCLDLKQDAGRAVPHQLAAQADVLIEGYRPGLTQRLGVDYASLQVLNPRLIYASLTGYGQTGLLAQRPGHDINFLAAADGKYLTLAALETAFWKRLVQVLELPELAVAELDTYPARVAKTDEIAAALGSRLRMHTLAHWAALLAQNDIPFSTVPDISWVLDDPHFQARGLFGANADGVFVHFPVAMRGVNHTVGNESSAPNLGEHSDAILAKFGVSVEDIKRLHQQGIIN